MGLVLLNILLDCLLIVMDIFSLLYDLYSNLRHQIHSRHQKKIIRVKKTQFDSTHKSHHDIELKVPATECKSGTKTVNISARS